jgi:hypothetical protein
MNPFKVGDKVRAVWNSGTGIIAGQIYILNGVSDTGTWVRFIDSNGAQNGWGAENFELVNSLQQATQKYQIGEYFIYNWNPNKFMIISYDSITEFYTLKEDNTGLVGRWSETELDKFFTKIKSGASITHGSSLWGKYQVTAGSMYQGLSQGVIGIDLALPPLEEQLKICDCGGDKTYGKNSGPTEHSSWCSKFSGSKA